MKLKTVKIILHNGIVEVFQQDKGTRVVVHDYDIQEDDGYCKRDRSGHLYRISASERR